MNEGRALDRERRGQMTSPEQRRQRDAARRSLNTIPQPQFQAPLDPPAPLNPPPLYRGGAYYHGVHPGFIPRNVAQPLPMSAYPNLPWNAVAHHQRNVGNYQPLAAAYGTQGWVDFNQRFQQEYQARQIQQFELGGHAQPSNQNHQNGGWVDHTQNLIDGTNRRHEERREARRQNRWRSPSVPNENFIHLQQQNLQREQVERLRARNAAVGDNQDALTQQFQAEVQERQENFNQRSQELQEAAELARLQQELRDQRLPLGCRPYVEPDACFSLENLDVVCPDYGALHFESEKLTSSTAQVKKFGLCCLQGKVRLPN